MKTQVHLSHSENETIQYAKNFSKSLKPGTVVALRGDLGSGKTTFIKGVALGLGAKKADDIKSPTFAIMHIYKSKIPLIHFDLYRLESEKEIANIGFEEMVADPKVVTCIEWAERAKSLMPKAYWSVFLETTGPEDRRITLEKVKVDRK